MRQNVVLIVLDTARADALEPYGARPGSTPAIADLARAGVTIEEVRAAAPWTLPSHATMFTGALARGLGVGQAPGMTPKSAEPAIRAQRERMLPEVLRRNRYATAALSANLWITPDSGFDVGFDRFATVATSRQAKPGDGRRQAFAWALEAMRARVDDGAAEAARVISSWIAEPPRGPFFWFVNLLECHAPYLPPRPYHALSPVQRAQAARDARRYLKLVSILRICTGNLEVPTPALERMRRLYAGCVRYLDAWVERFIEELDKSGRSDETLVLITSDHGENLGEGGLINHSLSLDDRLLRVPFVANGPGADTFTGLRSLAELPARIAAAIGLDDHPWHDRGLPAGIPVAQWDPLAAAADDRIQRFVSQWGADDETAKRLTTPLTCAIDGHWKLVRRGDELELYDLDSDADELSPMRGEAEIAARANDSLGRLRRALDHPATVASAESEPNVAESEVRSLEDQMRLLGYL